MTIRAYPPGPKLSRLDAYRLSSRRHNSLEFINEVAREYGDIAHFKVGPQHVFLLNHPDYIGEVLVNHYENFLKGRGRGRPSTQFLGNGLLTSEGHQHQRQRRLLQPAFHRPHISAYGEIIVKHGRRLRDEWRDGQVVEIDEEMRRLTLLVVGEAMFRSDIGEGEVGELNHALAVAIAQFRAFRLPANHLLDRLPLLRLLRFRRAKARLDAAMRQVIEERRRNPGDRRDLVSMLLLARDEEGDGGEMSDREVCDQALTIFVAAYETTALALAWTWYLLSQHRDVEAELHAEVDGVLGTRLPTSDDVGRLVYTKMVLAESMRLYPPAWRLVRRAINEFKVGGYIVPARSQVIMSQYVMHRDPRYFPDPSRFDPQRWTPEARAARPTYSYFPFGGAARRCIGEGFAWMEATLLLATLARRWRMRLVPGHPVEPFPTHILRPRHGIRMILEGRRA